ncbi:MAG: hypothetical protein LBS35_03725 [Synergistaceae bacterium]|jgi:hypothetical protein|nr:hypothetical protein [Synergistaceae bacterium]
MEYGILLPSGEDFLIFKVFVFDADFFELEKLRQAIKDDSFQQKDISAEIIPVEKRSLDYLKGISADASEADIAFLLSGLQNKATF